MSYIVHNLTKRTVILSDLRAEIPPQKMLDLERVAPREKIDRSHDLRLALNTSRLRLCSHGVVKKSKPEVVERIIEKEKHYHHQESAGIDEAKLIAILEKVLSKKAPSSGLDEKVLVAIGSIQAKLDALQRGEEVNINDMPEIDPELFANLQSKTIDKLSQEIETGKKTGGKRVVLKDTNIRNLADELD